MMKIQTLSFGLLLSIAPLGCAAKHSRSLARETLVQVNDYEASLLALAKTTDAYHETGLSRLRDEIGTSATISSNLDIDNLAADLADASLVRGDVTDAMVRDFLYNALTSVDQANLERDQRLARIEAESKATLEQIERQRKQLEAVRANLEQLQSGASAAQTMKDLHPLLEAVRAALDKESAANQPEDNNG